ncbi:unnamed protein product [Paramecium pentaurelia]|uniref:Uncharacterized protein n=1 Tax=Paramecium pentaurelia TaxID=43138 RepID=A0A8S1XNA6_9CILI|nr:unnamed protein product [Paramecium pentaurelia]
MQEHIALTIEQLTNLLSNSEQTSNRNSLNSLSQKSQTHFRQHIQKIVSFVDIDEFQETSISSGFQNSENQSIIDKLQELEDENKKLKETLKFYEKKECKWKDQMNDYQLEQIQLKRQNQVLKDRLKSIIQTKEQLSKSKKQIGSQRCNFTSPFFNQKPDQIKVSINPNLQVRKHTAPSGLKNSSPHRMFQEKKIDKLT